MVELDADQMSGCVLDGQTHLVVLAHSLLIVFLNNQAQPIAASRTRWCWRCCWPGRSATASSAL
eukprot:COSAG06_NODE_53847_length_297_cov_2.707071_1_plen_63_part_01